MVHVVLERQFDPTIDADDFDRIALDGLSCMQLYRVQWYESLLADDGRRLVCRFEAPDTESVRIIGRSAEARSIVAWAGTLHDTGREGTANVVVERSFAEPVTMASIQAIEDAGAWCLEQHSVTFLRTFFSADCRRMLCLYQAPDAESVRLAQSQAKMPVERVWSCRRFSVDHFSE